MNKTIEKMLEKVSFVVLLLIFVVALIYPEAVKDNPPGFFWAVFGAALPFVIFNN